MQRHVSFNTRLFESIKPQPHFINERCFGEDLATWLIARLPPAPFVVRKPIQEDYGWGFWVRQGHQSFWSAIGIEDESLGSAAPEWQITVAYAPGCNPRRRLWTRPDPATLLLLRGLIDYALHAELEIVDIQNGGRPSHIAAAQRRIRPRRT